MVEEHGDFIEIHVATPLEICETRDRKGLYARARAGLIKNFTGVSDPYESPSNPEIVIDTTLQSASEATDKILAYLMAQRYLARPAAKTAAEAEKSTRDPATLWTQASGAVLPLSGLAGMEGQSIRPDTPRMK